MKRRIFAAALSALTLLGATLGAAHAEDKPTVIRIGFPQAGTGGRPLPSGSYPATAELQGVIEEEFKADGIKIVWNHYVGAGPALNEAYANGLVDFAFGHGDLPLIVGWSTGLKRKVIMSSSRFGNSYFVVPSSSNAKTLNDLKGKKLATFKGTAGQLTLYRWLEKFNLTDKDVRIISLNNDDTKAALATGDIDGTVVTPFDLEARGVAKHIHEILDDPDLSSPGSVWVGEEFEKKYPQIVQRVVNRLLKSAVWSSTEANREKLFQYWAQAGSTPYIDYKKSWSNVADLRTRVNPLLDEYYVASLQRSISEAKKFKLIRRDVNLADFVEPKYLAKALKDQGLEDYWPQYDAAGKIKAPARKLASK
ncbi:MAG: TetR family transcriptional regulator [Rubrivivax sp.]|nr:MAG: TetR family transcriptional regulator [Rubrivivax sp.]